MVAETLARAEIERKGITMFEGQDHQAARFHPGVGRAQRRGKIAEIIQNIGGNHKPVADSQIVRHIGDIARSPAAGALPAAASGNSCRC